MDITWEGRGGGGAEMNSEQSKDQSTSNHSQMLQLLTKQYIKRTSKRTFAMFCFRNEIIPICAHSSGADESQINQLRGSANAGFVIESRGANCLSRLRSLLGPLAGWKSPYRRVI